MSRKLLFSDGYQLDGILLSLLLAEEKYIDLMLDLNDNHKMLDLKKNILIESLCVIVYDNIVDRDTDNEIGIKNERLIERVCGELRKRKSLVLEADYLIPDYIKKWFSQSSIRL